MLRKNVGHKKGQIIQLRYDSNILSDNPLNDPSERDFSVYLPAQYDNARAQNKRFPVLYDLVGYTGSGHAHVNWRNFEENVPELLDRLIATKKMPPCIVVFPDCYTALGGNQYINSSAIGDYADYLTQELIPFVDSQLRTLASREHRACFGKSSGGYGAMIHGMKYTKYWGAIANHSGDAYFDFVYKSDWPGVLTNLQQYATPNNKITKKQTELLSQGYDDGRIANFLKSCWQTRSVDGSQIMSLMMVCMAASYDPEANAPNGFCLPFNLDSGELINKRWKNWLKHDPIHLVSRYKNNLQKLSLIYIDCGRRDQYHIHFGSRQLSQQLKKYNIDHRYEEFDGTHSGIDHRMNVSLPALARSITN